MANTLFSRHEYTSLQIITECNHKKAVDCPGLPLNVLSWIGPGSARPRGAAPLRLPAKHGPEWHSVHRGRPPLADWMTAAACSAPGR